MRKVLAVCLAMVVGVPAAFATGASNNCNGNGSCSQDTTNSASVGNVTANGGSASATGGTGVGYGGAGGHGGSSYVDNDVRNTVTTTDVNVVSNDQYQGQGQVQGQSQNTKANSDQEQTQSANNEGVNVAGDNVKVYSYGHAVPTSAVGTDGISVGTVFGGVGFSQTSQFAKTDTYLARLIEACKEGIMEEGECRQGRIEAVKRMGKLSKKNDRGLLNFFGLF